MSSAGRLPWSIESTLKSTKSFDVARHSWLWSIRWSTVWLGSAVYHSSDTMHLTFWLKTNYAVLFLQCSFFDHRGLKVVYRRYTAFCFITGITDDEVWLLALLMLIVSLFDSRASCSCITKYNHLLGCWCFCTEWTSGLNVIVIVDILCRAELLNCSVTIITELLLQWMLQNELAVWEFIHNVAETLTEYFKKVVSILSILMRSTKSVQLTCNDGGPKRVIIGSKAGCSHAYYTYSVNTTT